MLLPLTFISEENEEITIKAFFYIKDHIKKNLIDEEYIFSGVFKNISDLILLNDDIKKRDLINNQEIFEISKVNDERKIFWIMINKCSNSPSYKMIRIYSLLLNTWNY